MVRKDRKTRDVIIVGAGPSGSTLGYLLAGKGLDVLVIDRKIFPRPKLCAGVVTWKTRKLVEDLFRASFESQFPVEYSSGVYSIYRKYQEKVLLRSPETFYFVDRKKYDMELVSLGEKKGCSFMLGCKVVDLDIESRSVLTRAGDFFSGRVIVGADGVNSVIRRKIYPQKYFRHNLALAFQVDIPLGRVKMKHDRPYPRLYVDGIKWGYGWIFPHKDHFVVGMCGLIRKNKKIKEIFTNFLYSVTELNKEEKAAIASHLVPFGSFFNPPGLQNILLVGDSAGFVDCLTGEGIYYAHKSAAMVAKAVFDFFQSGMKLSLLQSYKGYLASMVKELRMSRRGRDLVYGWLSYLPWFFVRNPKVYFRLAEIIHGRRSYAEIPVLPVGI